MLTDEWFTLKQALSLVAGSEWDGLNGAQQQSTMDRLAELARSSAVELRGNYSDKEFEGIPPNRFLKPHNFDVEGDAVVWVGRDAQNFPDAVPVPSPSSLGRPNLNPNAINYGAIDAQGRLKTDFYRSVVRAVMVNAVQLRKALGGNGSGSLPQDPAKPPRKKPTMPEALAGLICEEWPTGIEGVKAADRNKRIRELAKNRGFSASSDSTILSAVRLAKSRIV